MDNHVLAETGRKLTHAERAGMSEEEWNQAVKFDSTDWGWVIMSIGTAIGAGVVFLPLQIGLAGIFIFLIASVIAYPGLYLFMKLCINTLAAAEKAEDYSGIISGYLGKNWGLALGVCYFLMIVIWMLCYPITITNDSASFLQTFGVTDELLSTNPFYGLAVVCFLTAIASRGEQILFKVSTGMVLIKIGILAVLGVFMLPHWDLSNLYFPLSAEYLIKQVIIMIPFAISSILFVTVLSPMVISYRAHNKSLEVAHYKAMRAMKVAFFALFSVVFFYAISFNLAVGHDQAVEAYTRNISALAMAARDFDAGYVKIASLILNIFAIMTAFFSLYLGFRDACQGIVLNLLRRILPDDKISKKVVKNGIIAFTIAITWSATVFNLPILMFTSISSPLFGLIGCLIPAYLVYKVPALAKYKDKSWAFVIFTGLMLVISPFFAFS